VLFQNFIVGINHHWMYSSFGTAVCTFGSAVHSVQVVPESANDQDYADGMVDALV
jgi:hypothetical protein